jgi:hypothetical protein
MANVVYPANFQAGRPPQTETPAANAGRPPKNLSWALNASSAVALAGAGLLGVAQYLAKQENTRLKAEVTALQGDIANYRDDACRNTGEASLNAIAFNKTASPAMQLFLNRHFQQKRLTTAWTFYALPLDPHSPDYGRAGQARIDCITQSRDDPSVRVPYTAWRPSDITRIPTQDLIK